MLVAADCRTAPGHMKLRTASVLRLPASGLRSLASGLRPPVSGLWPPASGYVQARGTMDCEIATLAV